MGRKAKPGNSSPDMDPRAALFMAAVCEQTYMQLQGTGTIRLPDEYELAGTFQASSQDGINQPFGFVAKSPYASILAFRGTSSAAEWMADFMADQVDFTLVSGGGMTHRGFTALYQNARQNIFNILQAVPPDKPLFITGHSLGGALSTLAALDLAVNTDFRSPIVYTFAAPRVGNAAFADAYNQAVTRSFRIANTEDIVVHLPPLIYKDPRMQTIYYYSHVRNERKTDFKGGSLSANHLLSGYFNTLAEEEPEFAQAMCLNPPGWCPAPPHSAKSSE